MDGTESKTYKLPLLPAAPCDALQGKRVTQAMIDSTLAYDYNFRPSYVYLNETDAHNNAGSRNQETLAPILRTFVEDVNGKPHVVAEVKPNRKYRGEKFEELAASDGTHPGRSVDLWNKELIPGCKTDYYLEGIALCGAQKPATVNLPGVYYSTEMDGGILTFSINLTEKTMPEKDEGQKADFAAMQKQLDEQKGQVEQLATEIKTLAAERDHYKKEAENLSAGYQDLRQTHDRQEVERIFDKELLSKVKADEREGFIQLALSLKNEKVELATGQKSRYEQFLDSLRNRAETIKLSVVAGGVPTQLPDKPSVPPSPAKAIQQFATDNNIPMNSVENMSKAEEGARKEWPELFGMEAKNG